MKDRLRRFFLINDTPQKIALGAGLGVFLGIIPGTGPIASVILASFFRLNRTAALMASIAFNTWLNFAAFLLAIKIGSAIMGLDWVKAYQDSLSVFRDFRFINLFKLPILKIAMPLLIGYLVIAACMAVITYFTVLIIFKTIKKHKPNG